MVLMGLPLWAWIVFYVLVLLMLVADLKMFGKKGQHEVNVREALQMTAVWIGVSLVFCAGIYLFYPVTEKMHGERFFIVENGRRLATPLFVALLVIETTDVAFAVDSIPAVFSVSRDPFIVLTSNIFGVLVLSMLLSVVITRNNKENALKK